MTMLPEDEYQEKLAEEISKSTFRCRNCNYCYSQCPLYRSNEGFMVNGPSGIIQSIYYYLKWDLNTEEQKKDISHILFSCTTCNACVMVCEELSAGIPLLNIIENGRKLLVDRNIGPMPFQRNALKSLLAKGNPYNFNSEDRSRWAEGLDIKKMPDQKANLLYYVGCSASYDPEIRNIALSLVKLFGSVGVDFGILADEVCCGCTAKRLGDEFLFAEILQRNTKAFIASGIEQIVTTSPHCYNTFVKEYGSLADLKVQHYTEFFHNWFVKGRVPFKKRLDYSVTYHDPCYLTKHNQVYEEPRELLNAIPGVQLVEMRDNRKTSLCCGGGGGRMWTEIREEKRLANLRVEQALATGANVLAVACPWCHVMLGNAVKDLEQEGNIKVMDISELLVEALSF